MSNNSSRESLSDRIRRSVVAHAKSTNSPPVVFREQKRPNFIVPKSPTKSSHIDHARNKGIGTPNEPFSRRPRFITTPNATTNTNQRNESPRRPAFILPQKRNQETEIVDEQENSLEEAVHNPFNVSDELEEPVVPVATQRLHMSKRIMTSTPNSGRPIRGGTQIGRPTSEILSSLRFSDAVTQGRSTSPAVQSSADWSPHKRRGKTALEKDKFLPGGMAETVALWIYESQSRGNRSHTTK